MPSFSAFFLGLCGWPRRVIRPTRQPPQPAQPQLNPPPLIPAEPTLTPPIARPSPSPNPPPLIPAEPILTPSIPSPSPKTDSNSSSSSDDDTEAYRVEYRMAYPEVVSVSCLKQLEEEFQQNKGVLVNVVIGEECAEDEVDLINQFCDQNLLTVGEFKGTSFNSVDSTDHRVMHEYEIYSKRWNYFTVGAFPERNLVIEYLKKKNFRGNF